jgi:hypothetical protein
MRGRVTSAAVIVTVMTAVAGCGASHDSATTADRSGTAPMTGRYSETLPSAAAVPTDAGATPDLSMPDATSAAPDVAGGDAAPDVAGGDASVAGGAGGAAAPDTAGGAVAPDAAGGAVAPDTGGGGPGWTSPAPPPLPVPQGGANVQLGLRAGSVDDNAEFTAYLSYREQFAAQGYQVPSLDVRQRHVFTVTDAAGDPVLGADVSIARPDGHVVADLHTYSDGRALWFPDPTAQSQLSSLTATVTKGQAVSRVQIDPASDGYWFTLHSVPTTQSVPLDIEFVVDATGSMGDEISQLKASLSDISARIDALPVHPDVRFALTVYRDRVDSFLTRTWNFSSNLADFENEIAGVNAAGGGDYPEDVQQGLYDALHKPSWRGADAVKLMFLMGDAPPHFDYRNDPGYVSTAEQAASMGVKIETLAASGLDDQGEFVWRQIAEITMGQFLFLTYGPSGVPGDDNSHHVTGYAPMNLDDLVVGLVSQELAPLQRNQQQYQQ